MSISHDPGAGKGHWIFRLKRENVRAADLLVKRITEFEENAGNDDPGFYVAERIRKGTLVEHDDGMLEFIEGVYEEPLCFRTGWSEWMLQSETEERP